MKNNPRYLTKSRFAVALECPTKLYYYGKDKEYANLNKKNEFLQALAEGGYQVGELAKYYYPGGTTIEALDYETALKETNGLLMNYDVTIYEAAICFENFFIRVDILKKRGDDVDLVEVKAKSFSPTNHSFRYKRSSYIQRAWLPYLYDVAFQTWVTEKAFPEWSVVPYLMLADKSREASVNNLNQLFRIGKEEGNPKRKKCYTIQEIGEGDLGEDVLSAVPVRPLVEQIWRGEHIDPEKQSVEEKKPFIERIYEYSDNYKKDTRYPVSVGKKCKNCEYKSTDDPTLKSGYEECWKSAVDEKFDPNEPHVLDIWYAPKTEEMLRDGVYYMKDVDIQKYLMKTKPPGELVYTGKRAPRQALQIGKTQSRDGKEAIDEALFEEMSKWETPFHFMDFETSMVAIPFNEGRHPYEQVAFQFSCHTLDKDGQITHHEWINAQPGYFPNYDFVSALKNVLERDSGTIFRYSHHEKTVLRQIRNQLEAEESQEFDILVEWINSITDESGNNDSDRRSMVDLWKVVQKHYYHPDMQGSNSIKKVLPAVMKSSGYLKEMYSQPLTFGTNLKGDILWEWDEANERPKDPYKLLPSLFEDVDIKSDSFITEEGEIRDGGAAMMAYSYIQYSDMGEQERTKIIDGLLRYCELDTLAMLMIYQHWNSLKQ